MKSPTYKRAGSSARLSSPQAATRNKPLILREIAVALQWGQLPGTSRNEQRLLRYPKNAHTIANNRRCSSNPNREVGDARNR